MFGWLISHQWKEATRSSVWQKNLIINGLLGLFMLYLLANLLLLGFFLNKILEEIAPGQEVVTVFCKGIIYYLGLDLVLRFYLQELPVLAVQPYLHLPVSRSKLVHYLLGKSLLSFFNLLPFAIILPFAFRAVLPAYGPLPTLTWIAALACLLLVNNFLILYLKRQLTLKPVVVLVFAAFLTGLAILEYQKVLSFSGAGKVAFSRLLEQPLLLGLPLALLAAAYLLNYGLLRRNMYLQEPDKASSKVVVQEFAFLHKLGEAGNLLALELKLIWRNKRPRSIMLLSLLMVPYGLVFYTNDKMEADSIMVIFAANIITGAGMLNYGQLLHSWEGNHFDALLTRNINSYQYYRSKFLILAGMCAIAFLLSVPYVLLGWRYLLTQAAMALFNSGISTFIILFIAVYDPKKIDLSKGSAFNWQGIGAAQYLMMLPVFLLLLLIYLPFYMLEQSDAGLVALAAAGTAGLVMRKAILQKLAKRLMARKYAMAANFRSS